MSRRAKRRASSSSKSSHSVPWGRWVARLTLLTMLLAAVVSVAGYVWLRQYLSSKEFRQMIVTDAEKALRADTTLSPLRWDGFQVNADYFEASGESSLQQLSIEGVKTGIDAAGVLRGVWSVSPSRITKISATVDTTAPPPPQDDTVIVEAMPKKASWYDSWVPQKFETDSLIVNDSQIRLITRDGDAQMSGIRWEIEPTDSLEKCKLRASSGRIALPYQWAPEAKLERMRLTYQSGYLYLTDATMRVYENGRLTLGGEMDLASQSYSLEGSLSDIRCHDVLPADWRQRLTGVIESSFSLRSGLPSPTLKGKLTIQQGILTALPVLDKLAAYSQSLRFRTLTLHTAECDYEWSGDRIVLTNVKLGSEGLVRMEGRLTLTRMGAGEPYAMNGDFQVGLAPGTLARIPGAEEDVFVPGPRGLLWAPMRLSGTTENPKEDLSDRLMAAAGARMFEIIPATGQKVLKYSQQVIEDTVGVTGTVGKAVDVGSKIIGEGTGAVDQAVNGATGVVDTVLDIFGTKKDTIKEPRVELPPVIPTPPKPPDGTPPLAPEKKP